MAIDQQENMSFIDHLGELRKRIILSIIPVILFAGIIFYFFDILSDAILMSMLKKEFPTYRLFCYMSSSVGMESNFFIDIPMALREDHL